VPTGGGVGGLEGVPLHPPLGSMGGSRVVCGAGKPDWGEGALFLWS